MTLVGANNFHENEFCTIYTMNSATCGPYCVVLPKSMNGIVNMLVDFHMKSAFDGLTTGGMTKEQLVTEIQKEYDLLKAKYPNCMLVYPMFDEGSFQSLVLASDKQKMFDEVKKIGAITSEIYKKLTENGVEKNSIDQKIIIVEKRDEDHQFVEWLKTQMPNFVDGLSYNELAPKVETNPFMENPFVQAEVKPEPSVPETKGNDIFGSVTPSAPVVPETPAPVSVAPTDQPSMQETSFDIFGESNGVTATVVPAQPTESIPSVEPNVTSNSNVVATTVATEGTNPQPIQNVELEGTTTFSPIPENVSLNPEMPVEEVQEERKGSKGIANLLILFVVLIGVTIASIELGKFLYSVYGR